MFAKLKTVFNSNSQDPKYFRLLFKPSWLSLTFGIFFSLALVVIGFLTTKINNSVLGKALFITHNATSGVSSDYHTVINNLGRYQIINDVVLFAFWGGVALIVYLTATHLIKSLKDASDIEHEAVTVKSARYLIIDEAIMRLTIRIIALISLLILIKITIHDVFPYNLSSAHALALKVDLVNGLFTLISFLLMILMVHCLICCLRLLILRPRLFGYVPE